MYLIGTLIGAFFMVGITSRIALWIFKKFLGDTTTRIWLAHALSYGIAFTLAGIGFAQGGPFAWRMGLLYLLPQIVWLVIDLFAYKGRKAKAAAIPEAF